MDNYLKRLMWCTWCVCTCMMVYAQQPDYLHFRDSISKCDSIVYNVVFKYTSDLERQRVVRISLNGENEIRNYTPAQLVGFRWDGQRYDSRRLVQGGNIQHYFLPVVYQEDSVTIYKYLSGESLKEYYFSIGDSTALLVPMKVSRKRGGYSAAQAFLLSFLSTEDKEIRAYVTSMKPNPVSFDNRYTVVKRGNPNYINRFRWGVQVGAGMASLSGKGRLNYNYQSKSSLYAGLFLDIPVLSGLSIHPELFYQQYAFSYDSESIPRDFVAYNRKDLTFPVLFRYSFCSVKGKLIPFLQLGPRVDFGLKRDIEGISIISKENISGWSGQEWMDRNYNHIENFNIGLTGGVGVEWKVMSEHSLFLDLRYNTDFLEYRVSGFYLNVAFNL